MKMKASHIVVIKVIVSMEATLLIVATLVSLLDLPADVSEYSFKYFVICVRFPFKAVINLISLVVLRPLFNVFSLQTFDVFFHSFYFIFVNSMLLRPRSSDAYGHDTCPTI